ncbi:MAG: MarR family transcriptional regulator [Pseudomonadota bacterium]
MDQRAANDVLVALRRITRAIDLHSRGLIARHGLTVPQLLVLQVLAGRGALPTGELSSAVNLSNATVTSIVGRLVSRGLVSRRRSEQDRRVVLVALSEAGQEAVAQAPGLLQERFVRAFGELAPWEQSLILSSLQRVAAMMDADELDAAPMLVPGASVEPGPEG